ncbi:MAG: hypothetical protein U5L76_05470 [Patescibacteria group bacterium]|nr:hypothetical protein [Patescibacteria group bacterium]
MRYTKIIILSVCIFLFSYNIAESSVAYRHEDSCLIVGEVIKVEKYNWCEKTFDWDPEGFCGDNGYVPLGGAEYLMQFDTKLIDKKNYNNELSRELCNNLEIGKNYEFHNEIWEPEDENVLSVGDIYTSNVFESNQLGEIKKGNKLLYNYYSYYLISNLYLTIAIAVVLIAGIILLIIILKKKSKKDKIIHTEPKEPLSR